MPSYDGSPNHSPTAANTASNSNPARKMGLTVNIQAPAGGGEGGEGSERDSKSVSWFACVCPRIFFLDPKKCQNAVWNSYFLFWRVIFHFF